MLIIQVMGGLGNQLQQYALYTKMKSLGKEVKLDLSWYSDEKGQEKVLARRRLELDSFPHAAYEACTREEKERLTGTATLFGKVRKKLLPGSVRIFEESGIYHPEIFALEDCYLSGFWACEKYYADQLPALRKSLEFPLEKSEKNRVCAAQMEKETSVSLHLRRGDYMDAANAAMFGGICTERYYEAAINEIRRQCENPVFYLFSDDTAYAKEHYQGAEFRIVDWNQGADSYWDIWLMSRCRHHICANSTFSFWGARLDGKPGKIQIRPAKHKNSQEIVPADLHDWWNGWIFIDNTGIMI